MNNKNTQFLLKLSVIAGLIFILYLVLPKVYINEQSVTIEKEAYEHYTVDELLEGYMTKNSKVFINTNLGWKDTTLDEVVSLESEILLKVLSKVSFISSEENTIRIKGVDTIAPKIILHDENIQLEGGENLGDQLNFEVMDYRFGEYDFSLKKPSINMIPLTLGKHSFTLEAQDLSGNETTQEVQFEVIEHIISDNEANKSSVWINRTRKLPEDYEPNLELIPESLSSHEALSLEKNALKNLISMNKAFEKEFEVSLLIDKAFDTEGNPEYQSGLALRLETEEDFAKSDEFKWLEENAHKFGYIIRYPKNKEEITTYKFNPRFLRYVDKDIASYLYENKLSFEEYQLEH